VASVWDLPVLFVVENNGYGLSTPSSNEQFRCAQLADRARGYGMEGYTIDGNNILEVYDARAAHRRADAPRPPACPAGMYDLPDAGTRRGQRHQVCPPSPL
jgi:2-oxoisovalerate dehydrogenase E1 component